MVLDILQTFFSAMVIILSIAVVIITIGIFSAISKRINRKRS